MGAVQVDDIRVEGQVVLRSADAIVVEITSPFSGVLIDAALPPFASRCNSFDGAYGDDTVEFLLKTLYRLCRYTRDNFAGLEMPYRKLTAEIDELYTSGLPSSEADEQRFYRQTLFFCKWYRNMYVPRCSWDGLLTILRDAVDPPSRSLDPRPAHAVTAA